MRPFQALGDGNLSVRIAANEALGKPGSAEATDPLVRSLRSPAVEIRKAATESLGRNGSRAAVQPLIDRLDDPGWRVRRAAAYALGGLGDQRTWDLCSMPR